jgi:hypothetical protein
MGTAVGLVKYRDRTFYRVNGLEDLAEKKVYRIAASASGAIWVHAGRAVFRFETRRDPVNGNSIRFREIQEDKEGWLSVVLDYAWIKISPDGSRSITNCTKGISAGGGCVAGWQGLQTASGLADLDFWN